MCFGRLCGHDVESGIWHMRQPFVRRLPCGQNARLLHVRQEFCGRSCSHRTVPKPHATHVLRMRACGQSVTSRRSMSPQTTEVTSKCNSKDWLFSSTTSKLYQRGVFISLQPPACGAEWAPTPTAVFTATRLPAVNARSARASVATDPGATAFTAVVPVVAVRTEPFRRAAVSTVVAMAPMPTASGPATVSTIVTISTVKTD